MRGAGECKKGVGRGSSTQFLLPSELSALQTFKFVLCKPPTVSFYRLSDNQQ